MKTKAVDALNLSVLLIALLTGYFLSGSSLRLPLCSISGLATTAVSSIAVCLAVISAALPAAIRHTYNLHYLVGLAFIPITWLIPLVALWLGGDFSWIYPVSVSGILLSVPWSAGHLFASLSPNRSGALTIALAAVFVSIAALRIGHFLIYLIPIAAIAICAKSHFRRPASESAPAKSNAGYAIVAFLILNGMLACCLIPLCVLAYRAYTGYTWVDPQDIFQIADQVTIPEQINWIHLSVRWGIGLILGLCAVGAVYIYPAARYGPLRITGAVGGLMLAAALTGQVGLMPALASAALLLTALIAAASLASFEPRAHRLPYALVAGAIGFTIGCQILALFPRGGMLNLGLWFAEGAMIVGVWLIAYLFGLRVIRARQEPAAA